jgi:hypothetical protein
MDLPATVSDERGVGLVRTRYHKLRAVRGSASGFGAGDENVGRRGWEAGGGRRGGGPAKPGLIGDGGYAKVHRYVSRRG